MDFSHCRPGHGNVTSRDSFPEWAGGNQRNRSTFPLLRTEHSDETIGEATRRKDDAERRMSLRQGSLQCSKRTEGALLPLRYVPASNRQRVRGSGVGALSEPDLDRRGADLPQVVANRPKGLLFSLWIAAQPDL